MSSLIRDDDGVSNPSANDHLHDLIEREIVRNPSRRNMLKSGAALGLFGIFGSALTACGGGSSAPAPGTIGFKAVAVGGADALADGGRPEAAVSALPGHASRRLARAVIAALCDRLRCLARRAGRSRSGALAAAFPAWRIGHRDAFAVRLQLA